jgi:hypothetical protein
MLSFVKVWPIFNYTPSSIRAFFVEIEQRETNFGKLSSVYNDLKALFEEVIGQSTLISTLLRSSSNIKRRREALHIRQTEVYRFRAAAETAAGLMDLPLVRTKPTEFDVLISHHSGPWGVL